MKEISRRKFLQISALTAGATMLPMPLRWLGAGSAQAFAQSPPLLKSAAYKLRGLDLPASVLGLIPNTAFYANDPAGIPVLNGTADPFFAKTTMYDVAAGEFTDQLHPGMGPTTVWGYYDKNTNIKRHLGGVVIAARGTATRLRMTNTLPPTNIIPVDSTIPGTGLGIAQNRIAVHLHGGFVPWICDGGPFDWWTPGGAGGNGLSYQNGPGSVLDNIPTKPMAAGQGDLFYPNDQSTRLMWYHDHAHGITRTNAYAGLATGYVCLDMAQETAAGTTIPPITSLIPLVYQDKIFVNPATIAVGDPTWPTVAPPRVQTSGSLWYAHIYDPKLYRLRRNMLPPPDPSCIPEFFGDTMLCNGTVAPVVEVEQRRFRFMLLNACNARFLNINMLKVQANCEVTTNPKTLLPVGQFNYVTNTPVAVLPTPGPNIIQIGTEGGYLQKPVTFPAIAPTVATGNIVPFNPATFTGNLIIGCAERADFIIDFTAANIGDEFVFYNDSPGPFPAGAPVNDYFAGNGATPAAIAGSTVDTRNVLRFKVIAFKPGNLPDSQVGSPMLPPMNPPAIAAPPAIAGGPLTVPVGTLTRDLTLNEDFDAYGRLRQLLGTTMPALVGKGFGLDYLAPATEIIAGGTTEVWRIFNLSADTHPVHFHLQDCQVVSRQPFKIVSGRFTPTGVARGPQPNELGWKETVQCHPGEVTSVIFKWDMVPVPFNVPYSTRTMGALGAQIAQANEFVWHCHILEHEEHDMMRPLVITGPNPKTPLAINPATASFNGSLGGTTRFYMNSGTGPYTPASSGANVTVTAGTLNPGALNQVDYVDAVVAPLTGPGTATITVTDSSAIPQTVSAAIDIFGVAPYSAAIGGLVGGIASFTVGGGTAPYAFATSDLLYPAVPTATGFDVTVVANPAWVTGTIINVTYTITDAAGRQATVTLAIN